MKQRISTSKAERWFAAKGVEVKVKDTMVDGRNIRYAVTGNDSLPTLVFIHGSPGSWFHYMRYMYDSSLLSKFRMIGIDRPGFGHSDFGDAMHLQDQSRLLVSVLKNLRNDKPMYVAGHSMGACVVVQMAAYEPSLFSKIILLAAPIDVKLEKKELWRHIMEVRPFYWCLPRAFAPSNTELLWLKKDLIPFADDLKKVTTDVIFVHGDKDTWVPIENVAYGIKMMTNARSIRSDTLRGADHQIPWKNQDSIKAVLLRLY
jgi:pimeloyl-ACP methyl ester carboxylesterase